MNIEDLLKIMVEKDASDIYLTAGIAPAYRVEGKRPYPQKGNWSLERDDEKWREGRYANL